MTPAHTRTQIARAQIAGTRIAPTPSGYLHPGNAVNFLLARWLADDLGLGLRLRIDDMDADRMRPEYVQDIFEVLTWLGISWQAGPVDADDFRDRYRLQARMPVYREQAMELMRAGLAYACACSRREGTGQCVKGCRTRHLELVPGQSALRLAIEPGTVVQVDGITVDLHRELGDPVLWRRDDQVAYHLASVIEDRDQGITEVVRGADLRLASALHLHLSTLCQATVTVRYRHHPLLLDANGYKLSKSQLRSGPMERTDALRQRIHDQAAALAGSIGLHR